MKSRAIGLGRPKDEGFMEANGSRGAEASACPLQRGVSLVCPLAVWPALCLSQALSGLTAHYLKCYCIQRALDFF